MSQSESKIQKKKLDEYLDEMKLRAFFCRHYCTFYFYSITLFLRGKEKEKGKGNRMATKKCTVFRFIEKLFLTLFKFFYLIFYITILHKSLIIHENSGMFKDVYEVVNSIRMILVKSMEKNAIIYSNKNLRIHWLEISKICFIGL